MVNDFTSNTSVRDQLDGGRMKRRKKPRDTMQQESKIQMPAGVRQVMLMREVAQL